MRKTPGMMARAAADNLGAECIAAGNRIAAIGRALNDGQPVDRRRLARYAIAVLAEMADLARRAEAGATQD